MTDLVTFLENKGKVAIYIGENIHALYHYLSMIVSPTNLTSSVHSSNPLCSSSSNKNDTESLQTLISAICVRHKIIC